MWSVRDQKHPGESGVGALGGMAAGFALGFIPGAILGAFTGAVAEAALGEAFAPDEHEAKLERARAALARFGATGPSATQRCMTAPAGGVGVRLGAAPRN